MVEYSAASCTPTVEGVAVIKRGAPGDVPVVVEENVMPPPIESPVRPAPPITSEEANSEAGSEGEIRPPAKPNSRIWIPPRPGCERASVDHPRIVGGNVDDIGRGGLNDDCGILRVDCLLRSGFKVASLFCPLAHHLDGIHHILLLVVIGVPERGGPREILVHVAKNGRKCGERLNAGVPRLLVHSFTQIIAF
jgi:hypothetical protein